MTMMATMATCTRTRTGGRTKRKGKETQTAQRKEVQAKPDLVPPVNNKVNKGKETLVVNIFSTKLHHYSGFGVVIVVTTMFFILSVVLFYISVIEVQTTIYFRTLQ